MGSCTATRFACVPSPDLPPCSSCFAALSSAFALGVLILFTASVGSFCSIPGLFYTGARCGSSTRLSFSAQRAHFGSTPRLPLLSPSPFFPRCTALASLPLLNSRQRFVLGLVTKNVVELKQVPLERGSPRLLSGSSSVLTCAAHPNLEPPCHEVLAGYTVPCSPRNSVVVFLEFSNSGSSLVPDWERTSSCKPSSRLVSDFTVPLTVERRIGWHGLEAEKAKIFDSHHYTNTRLTTFHQRRACAGSRGVVLVRESLEQCRSRRAVSSFPNGLEKDNPTCPQTVPRPRLVDAVTAPMMPMDSAIVRRRI